MKTPVSTLILPLAVTLILAGCSQNNGPKVSRLACDVDTLTEFPKIKQRVDDKGKIYLTVTEYPDAVTDFSAEGKPASFNFYGKASNSDSTFSNNSHNDEWNFTREYKFGDSLYREIFKLNRISGEIFYSTLNERVRKYVSGTCEKAKGDWRKF